MTYAEISSYLMPCLMAAVGWAFNKINKNADLIAAQSSELAVNKSQMIEMSKDIAGMDQQRDDIVTLKTLQTVNNSEINSIRDEVKGIRTDLEKYQKENAETNVYILEKMGEIAKSVAVLESRSRQ